MEDRPEFDLLREKVKNSNQIENITDMIRDNPIIENPCRCLYYIEDKEVQTKIIDNIRKAGLLLLQPFRRFRQ